MAEQAAAAAAWLLCRAVTVPAQVLAVSSLCKPVAQGVEGTQTAGRFQFCQVEVVTTTRRQVVWEEMPVVSSLEQRQAETEVQEASAGMEVTSV